MRAEAGLLALLIAAAPAAAQTLPASALENFRHVELGNGVLTARVYPPGENELYRGTRFDHAGVVFHVTYKGQDYNSYWFDRFVTDPAVTGPQPRGIETSCCATSGPMEEFAPVGFDEAGPPSCSEAIGQNSKCGRFLKPGVGVFRRNSNDDHPVLPALNEGVRTFKATGTRATFTQDISDESGYGYHYVKTVRLVPGKPQMVIEHVLKNTGTKPIDTTVFCHNFLTLDPGNAHIVMTAPFAITAEKPLQADLAKVDGKTIRYLAPLPAGTTVMSLLDGFGPSARDYDFTVTDTATGFGQRIRGDQPVAKINMWSIDTTYSLEPYIAISLKPGETKRWIYTYDFFGPGDKR